MTPRTSGLLIALCLIGAAPPPVPKFKAVTFTESSPLARNGELIKRFFSPFAYADLLRKNDPAALNALPIEPKDEKFGLYVPPNKPAKGYALLVWVSPLDGAGMPPSWTATLDDQGVIFVTAAKSGNETSPVGRRIPLALTAAANVARTYEVDPNRIWIAGFSGGARIAERMALGYPDVFTGAILDGSADVIGSADVPLPPREHFELLLDRMAIVLTTGQADAYNTDDAKRVILSMRRHCLDRLSVEVRPREGHEMMKGGSLAKAIQFLDEQRTPGHRRCREELYSKIDAELARAEALVQKRNRSARGPLQTIDRRYGRLAAPRSLELRARLGA